MKNLDYSLFVGMKNNINFCTDANAIIFNTSKTLEGCTVRLFNDYFRWADDSTISMSAGVIH